MKLVRGRYLVIPLIGVRQWTTAEYSPAERLGWYINGRWLGHDAVECFQALPPLPPPKEKPTP